MLRLIKASYFMLANTLLFFIGLILLSHAFLSWRYSASPMISLYDFLTQEAKSAYSHLTKEQVNNLLRATWRVDGGGWEYEEWVGFREVARISPFVNVNEFGIRHNSSNPPTMREANNAVWIFGGSTTFGYGVADSETIPALLEAKVQKPVYNFGRGYFYSAQENTLMRQLLKAGYRPKEVLFLEGINERCDIRVYQGELKNLFSRAQRSYAWSLSDLVTPLRVGLERVGEKYFMASKEHIDVHSLECSSYGQNQPLSDVMRSHLLERKALCEQYGLTCITFVLPFAGVHGTHVDFLSLPQKNRDILKEKFEYLEDTWKSMGATFLTNVLDQYPRHSFVDAVHYSLEANKRIAEAIALRTK